MDGVVRLSSGKFSPSRSGAAIIICHPWTSNKEQLPANYARVLSASVFTCLIYDAAYAPFAAQTDLRIKAVATSAAVCVGTMARRAFDNDVAGHSKIAEVHMLPAKLSDADTLPASFKDLAQYYRGRVPHERAPNTCLPRSWDLMASFDAFRFNEWISPRPLMMVTGSRAATKWYSKKLVVVEGLTHADLYDHVGEAGGKLVEFCGKYLK
ncbi:hypothetical protein EK21DRAFT_95727 [Setomelanomma holmii]|uniref:Uncharacterized protein n=1 Tax=Setomelanomma holmii TaxID=210430 RepID=A0A9P4LU40_9PLEO|nr:hypothetical protein EK21DRAFT_95727 [Setomelanomma holmii]